MSCPVGIKLHAIAGWDGDRLVHTERIDAEHPGQRQITHTVYEPESFTPLLRLSTATKQQGKPNALVQALGAGLQDGDEDDHQALVMMQAMLGAMPKDLQDSAQASMQQALQQGLPPSALAAMPDEGKNTLQRLSDLREQLEKQEQSEQTPIEVLYFHCDHLGTPLALTDPSRNIVWAAQLDPWGNVLQEFNPQNIEQPIRLPGQHHDRETGLYYNRHRYYDPSIGSYINQDPIGLRGGGNFYLYPLNPVQMYDPHGLNGEGGGWEKFKNLFDWGSKAKDINDKAETAKKANDVIKQQKEIRKIEQQLYRCIEVPTPKDCPTSKQLSEMEKKAHEMRQENIKTTTDIYKDLLDTPGTSTGGPITSPRPRP